MSREIEYLKEVALTITSDYGKGGNPQKKNLWDAINRVEESINESENDDILTDDDNKPGDIKAIDIKVHTGDTPYIAYIEAEISHKKWANWITHLMIGRSNDKYRITDKLRQMGYAVPYDKLSVDKLIEYGWVKISKK